MKSVFPALLAVLLGCAQPAPPASLRSEEPNALAFLSVSCTLGTEAAGRRNTLELRVENTSDQPLEEVRFGLNGTHSAALEDLFVHRGFKEGMVRFGSSTLEPGADLTLVVSHDTANAGVLRDEHGEGLPTGTILTDLEIRAKAGTGRWFVE